MPLSGRQLGGVLQLRIRFQSHSRANALRKAQSCLRGRSSLYDTVSTPETFADLFSLTADCDLCLDMKAALARLSDGLLKLPREENRQFFAGMEALRRLLASALERPKRELLYVTSRGESTADDANNKAFLHIFTMKLSLMVLTGALPQKDAETLVQPDGPESDKRMLN